MCITTIKTQSTLLSAIISIYIYNYTNLSHNIHIFTKKRLKCILSFIKPLMITLVNAGVTTTNIYIIRRPDVVYIDRQLLQYGLVPPPWDKDHCPTFSASSQTPSQAMLSPPVWFSWIHVPSLEKPKKTCHFIAHLCCANLRIANICWTYTYIL